MAPKLYYHIADIIQRYRTWIRVADTERRQPVGFLCGHSFETRYVQSLTLQSYVYRFGYLQGHLWHIPQTDLQQGLLKAMETDSSIRHRADSLSLTAKDVTLLMSCATQGKVRLELDDNPY